MKRRLTPHPVSAFESPIRIDNPVGNGRPRTYIHCTEPVYDPLEATRQWVRKQESWHWQEIATAHDAMVTAPEELARMLASISWHRRRRARQENVSADWRIRSRAD